MHVAQFVHRYPPALGGAEAYTHRLSEHLLASGDHVTVWTSTAIELPEMWNGSPGRTLSDPRHTHAASDRHEFAASRELLDIRRFPPLAFPGRRYLLKALSLLPVRPWQCLTMPCNPICPGMWREAGRYTKPLDAVHALAFPYSFPIVCGLRLARRRGVPFVVTPFLHIGDPSDPHDRTRRSYTAPHLRWLLRQADRILVQTRIEQEAVIGLGIPPERVVLQGLGVEPRECTGGDRELARQAWGVARDEVVIGHLSNNSIEKGTVDLLRAAARAWANGLRFRVILAGPEMPNFHTFWSAFPLPDRVVRLGVLTDSQKRDFFAGIDAFALPSRSDSFGLVLLEAWANHKPNLVYRAGGPAELIRHEVDGLQVPCGDVHGLAVNLTRLVTNPELRQRLAQNGHARITREFRWADKLELVRNLLAAGRLGTSRQHREDRHGPQFTRSTTKSTSPVGRST